MTDITRELLDRLKRDMDLACTDGPRPQWNLPHAQTDRFKAVAREMILISRAQGTWPALKAKLLAENNIEVVETTREILP